STIQKMRLNELITISARSLHILGCRRRCALLLNPTKHHVERFLNKRMRLGVLAAIQEFELRRILPEVMAHPRQLQISGAAGMQAVDHVGEVVAFVGASSRVGSAVEHKYGNIDLLPLLGQT